MDVVPEALELSPDGRSLALGGGWNTALEIRDAASLDERSTVELAMGDRVTDLTWSEDGGQLLAAGEGGGLHVVDAATWEASAPALASDAAAHADRVLPDGRTVVLSRLARSGCSTSNVGSPGTGCRRRSGTGCGDLHGARPDRGPGDPQRPGVGDELPDDAVGLAAHGMRGRGP